jgi:hypothetical protein
MELILKGLKNTVALAKEKPAQLAGFVLVSMLVAFAGFLPVLIQNRSWLDSMAHIRNFFNAANQSIMSGSDWLAALDVNQLGPAGIWVFVHSLWRYLILIPFQIVLFLTLAGGRQKNFWKGLVRFPAVVAIQLFTGLAIIALAVVGIMLTIALFAGAAAPFFMIIVLFAVLMLVVMLILAPFGHVLDRMPIVASVSLAFNKSLRYGWAIFLTMLIPAFCVSMIGNWLGQYSLLIDFASLLFFVPQYGILLSIYERMRADDSKAVANV